MDLFLDPAAKRTATRVLFEQLREAIVSGRLAAGDRLPPTRELATQLGTSRHTITTVYGRLVAEGFVEGHAGGGTYVSRVNTAPRVRTKTATLRPVEAVIAPDVLPDVLPDEGHGSTPPRFDLRIGMPDVSEFPAAAWRRCLAPALHSPPQGYGDPAGMASLRAAIARWIGRSRGVDVDADHVVVTSGAQQAIDLVLRLLLPNGAVVAVEDPGYPPVRRLCLAMGARVVPIPVDDEGIVPEHIPARARIVYTTPSHQFPTGATMSLSRRHALLEIARRHDMAIIEDDYDSEYRHVDRPLEPLHRLDRSGRVVYVGTFSKILTPALRLGFAVLPDSIVAAAINLRTLMDWQPPGITQAGLERFIVEGLLDRHLRRMRKIYSERHRLVRTFVEEHVASGDLSTSVAGNAGLHLTGHLPGGSDEASIRAHALAGGVAVDGLTEMSTRPHPPTGLVIGFGAIPTSDLAAALAIVSDALRGGGSSPHGQPRS